MMSSRQQQQQQQQHGQQPIRNAAPPPSPPQSQLPSLLAGSDLSLFSQPPPPPPPPLYLPRVKRQQRHASTAEKSTHRSVPPAAAEKSTHTATLVLRDGTYQLALQVATAENNHPLLRIWLTRTVPHPLLAHHDHKTQQHSNHGHGSESWSGEFSQKYIESVTRKTGNFKKFDVFVNMLVSGMSQSEPSIHLDLLTTQDLESLNQSGSSSSTTLPPLPADRRFLIMSYLVSFDRVHYPLPLAYCPQPTDASTLLAMLAHLQSDNERLEQATHELQFQLQQSRSASTARGRQESAARDAESARRDSRLEHLEREIEDLAQALELAHDDARKWRNRYDDLAAAQTTRAAMPVTTRSRNSSPAATAARGGSSSGRPQYSARSPSSSSFTGSPSRQPASRAPPPHTPPRAPWGSRRAAHDSNGRSPAASRRPATMPPTSTQSPNRRLPPPPGAARPHSSPTRRGSDPASLPQRRPNWQRSWSKDRGLARQVPPPLATRGTHLPPAAVVTARTNSGYVPLRSKPLRTADNRGSPIKRFDPTEWARRHADRFGRDAAAAVPERPASGARDRSHSAGSQRSVQSSYSTRSAQAAPSSNRYTYAVDPSPSRRARHNDEWSPPPSKHPSSSPMRRSQYQEMPRVVPTAVHDMNQAVRPHMTRPTDPWPTGNYGKQHEQDRGDSVPTHIEARLDRLAEMLRAARAEIL